MKIVPPDIIQAARNAQRQYGILSSVQLGQWCLESAWGAKLTGANNPFGIKALASQPGTLCTTHEFVNGERIETQCRFRDFATVQEAFNFHCLLLSTAGPYRAAWAVRDDLEAYVRAIAPHYATDPSYADELLGVIHGDDLTRYDSVTPDPTLIRALETGGF